MQRELEIILNSTHDGMIVVNKEGKITLFNRAAENLTGLRAQDVIGEMAEKVIQNTRLPYILETGESELNRQQMLGNIKIVTNRMPVKDEDSKIVGAIAVFRDITEVIELAEEITNLKEIQSLLEAIINSTQDAITVVNQDGIGVIINPAYIKLTGLSERDVIGKPATVDIAEGESIHLKVLGNGQPVKNARLKVGPNAREVIANAAPIFVDGKLWGSVGVLQDVSEIKKLTEELNQAKRIIRNLEAKYTFDDIVIKSSNMEDVIERAKMAAQTPATVILRGESGTGKELFAHAIHNASKRKFNQFIRVNCAAIPESLLESELFGYDEGAFTGARKGGRKGFFEEASGGTIFLDEIGEINLSTQVKLLRVLQEREIVRVGSNKPIAIDVRIIAATNVDLERAVKEGRFREDLYYRLNVIPIKIPALRERPQDIYGLVLHLLKKFNQSYGRVIRDISKEALKVLENYNWPGNIRELENVIGRSIINMKTSETIIEGVHLPSIQPQAPANASQQITLNNDQSFEGISLNEFVENQERKYIQQILEKNNNNKTITAKELGISVRSLYYKMERYNIQ